MNQTWSQGKCKKKKRKKRLSLISHNIGLLTFVLPSTRHQVDFSQVIISIRSVFKSELAPLSAEEKTYREKVKAFEIT